MELAHAYEVGVPPPWWWEADDSTLATLLQLLTERAEKAKPKKRR